MCWRPVLETGAGRGWGRGGGGAVVGSARCGLVERGGEARRRVLRRVALRGGGPASGGAPRRRVMRRVALRGGGRASGGAPRRRSGVGWRSAACGCSARWVRAAAADPSARTPPNPPPGAGSRVSEPTCVGAQTSRPTSTGASTGAYRRPDVNNGAYRRQHRRRTPHRRTDHNGMNPAAPGRLGPTEHRY